MNCSGRGRHQHLCHKTTSVAKDNDQALHGTHNKNVAENPDMQQKFKDEVSKPDNSVAMATQYNSILGLEDGGGVKRCKTQGT